jgi:hypothetical protein
MWSLIAGIADMVDCSGKDSIQAITGRCALVGGWIDIKLTSFVNCFHQAYGAVIYVVGDSLVFIRSDSFFNCIAGTTSDPYYGGCAYIVSAKSGPESPTAVPSSVRVGAVVWRISTDRLTSRWRESPCSVARAPAAHFATILFGRSCPGRTSRA